MEYCEWPFGYKHTLSLNPVANIRIRSGYTFEIVIANIEDASFCDCTRSVYLGELIALCSDIGLTMVGSKQQEILYALQ